MKTIKRLLQLSVIGIIVILLIDVWITFRAKPSIYDNVQDIKSNKVGLLLGVGKYTSGGNINLYYKYRVDATVELYREGKITYVLVSGDNSRKDYDEPTQFKNDLIKRGIPENKIYLDYAGFRTLDSIIRAKDIFGLSEFTIISQKFHNERALFLAYHYGLDAIAFNAEDIKGKYALKTKLREYLARSKAVFDLIFGVDPKFLGKQIEIV